MSAETEPGSTADGDAFYTQYGLHIRMSIKLESSLVRTTWSKRREVSAVLTDILSSFTSFLSAFGGILLAYDIIRGFNYPDRLHFIPAILNRIFAPFDETPSSSKSSEQDMAEQPYSDSSSPPDA